MVTNFICDSVLKDKLCKRLDDLFFKANSMAAGIPEIYQYSFYNSLGNYFKSFCETYKTKTGTFYEKIIHLDPHAIVELRNHKDMQELVSNFKDWLTNATNLLFEAKLLGAKKGRTNQNVFFLSKLARGILCVVVAKFLGDLLAEKTHFNIPYIDDIIENLFFFIPFIKDMVKKTPAIKVLEFISEHDSSHFIKMS